VFRSSTQNDAVWRHGSLTLSGDTRREIVNTSCSFALFSSKSHAPSSS
jgi:hypothetical protein